MKGERRKEGDGDVEKRKMMLEEKGNVKGEVVDKREDKRRTKKRKRRR